MMQRRSSSTLPSSLQQSCIASALLPHPPNKLLLHQYHGVRYGQTVTGTEIQYLNTIQVQIGETIPPNQIPPGHADIGHVSVVVSQKNKSLLGVLSSTLPREFKKGGYAEESITVLMATPP